MQSRVLAWGVGAILAAACLAMIFVMNLPRAGVPSVPKVQLAGLLSLTFAGVVWALRAATPMASCCGGMICLIVTVGTCPLPRPLWHSGLLPLMALFVLTFLATRAGRERKQKARLAESRHGRDAAQVIANLGAGALLVIAGIWFHPSSEAGAVMLLGVLAEATADTVSSEIGQAFGGTPILLTTLRPVAAGTDGAISAVGTCAGVFGAALVVLAGAWSMQMSWRMALCGLLGGIAGLLFDSLLGATLERKGLLGNDLVNFFSTVFAGVTALCLALPGVR